ncbi:hypothetical protein F4774DRAFT_421859 [Daldinia eschscholtzii]|nr:hypothetical protein F4774DRAFT_421859 [Daldinia eschscholtzii]
MFGDPDRKQTAQRRLLALKQTKSTFQYTIEFKRLLAWASERVQDEIYLKNRPAIFQDYCEMAIKINNHQYRHEQAKGSEEEEQRTSTPQSTITTANPVNDCNSDALLILGSESCRGKRRAGKRRGVRSPSPSGRAGNKRVSLTSRRHRTLTAGTPRDPGCLRCLRSLLFGRIQQSGCFHHNETSPKCYSCSCMRKVAQEVTPQNYDGEPRKPLPRRTSLADPKKSRGRGGGIGEALGRALGDDGRNGGVAEDVAAAAAEDLDDGKEPAYNASSEDDSGAGDGAFDLDIDMARPPDEQLDDDDSHVDSPADGPDGDGFLID